jgi:hypothetical protein
MRANLKRTVAALMLALTLASVGTANAQVGRGYVWNCYRAYWVVIGYIWVHIGTFSEDQSGWGVECYPVGGNDSLPYDPPA